MWLRHPLLLQQRAYGLSVLSLADPGGLRKGQGAWSGAKEGEKRQRGPGTHSFGEGADMGVGFRKTEGLSAGEKWG